MDLLLLVKAIHYLGFAGCLGASLWKNRLLMSSPVAGHALKRLLLLDRVSGASALVILLSGLALTLRVAQPTEIYTASQLYWLKVSLFATASIAVVMTKPGIRRAASTGILVPTARIRFLLLFDLLSILCVATLGRLLAHGSVL